MTLSTLSQLPSLLQPDVQRLWQDYQTRATTEQQEQLVQQTKVFESLTTVWACSPFVAKHCVQFPSLLSELIDYGALLAPSRHYSQLLTQSLLNITEEAALMRVLRLFRRREMVRIAWRDLAGWATLEETLQSLSDLADAVIDASLTWLYHSLTQQLGTPCNDKGIAQSLVVLAMGKLGGQELNFSSDIDLVLAYPESGETVGVKRARTNQEFFIRLGQKLIQVLNHTTEDGFVFRVDMRLRPFGESGPLVISFAAMEEYYQAHARDWERYALVKGRIAGGDRAAGQVLLDSLRPFIYRRYLDFNAIEALRNMKALIDQETSRKGLNTDIKLGQGGIREIEFTCQIFQLIRGGRQPALQQRHLLTTLKQLDKYHLLPTESVKQLREAYFFLRLTENHLQAIEDRQTQILPEDELNQTRLAYSMGFSDWNHFLAKLLYHRQHVVREFEQVIMPTSNDDEALPSTHSNRWQTLWLHGLYQNEQAEFLLNNAGFQVPAEVLSHLQQLVNSYSVQKLNQRGRERLDILIPALLVSVVEQEQKDEAIHRLLKLIEAIAQRSVYLALLIERPLVLKQLVRLCAQSAWIAEQITRYPLLLDELLDQRRLYDPLKPYELDNALNAQLAHVPASDLEMQMDNLRQFKRAQVLHVAAAETSAKLTVEITSDYLAAIADTLLRRTLAMAYDYLTQKHGQPSCHDQGQSKVAGFCIVAYGKAGGIELSYGSDLDIVFLHDSCHGQAVTNGNKPVENSVFFMRLAQRIIHILTANTPAGVLYEVDSRLRPGGASGLLVSSFDAFESYQQQDAWTWEHQALVRARAVAGNQHSMRQFENIRRHILSLERQVGPLKQEVREMRRKMRDNLDKSTVSTFDLKQGQGGMVDIEFLVQYGVLRWALNYPTLRETTGMLPLLRLFARYGLFDRKACSQLSEAFRVYRAEIHRLALQNQPALVTNEKFIPHRQQVTQWWTAILE